MSLSMVLEAVLSPFVIVHGKLSGRRDDQDSCSLLGCEVRTAKEFNSGNHIGQGLTTACLGSSEDVAPIQDVRYRASLDLCSLSEAQTSHSFLGLFGQWQIAELDSGEVIYARKTNT